VLQPFALDVVLNMWINSMEIKESHLVIFILLNCYLVYFSTEKSLLHE